MLGSNNRKWNEGVYLIKSINGNDIEVNMADSLRNGKYGCIVILILLEFMHIRQSASSR